MKQELSKNKSALKKKQPNESVLRKRQKMKLNVFVWNGKPMLISNTGFVSRKRKQR